MNLLDRLQNHSRSLALSFLERPSFASSHPLPWNSTNSRPLGPAPHQTLVNYGWHPFFKLSRAKSGSWHTASERSRRQCWLWFGWAGL